MKKKTSIFKRWYMILAYIILAILTFSIFGLTEMSGIGEDVARRMSQGFLPDWLAWGLGMFWVGLIILLLVAVIKEKK